MLACETIEIAERHDPNDCALKDLTSLGLLQGMAILPHFTDRQLADGRRRASQHGVEVLGLPESAGLRCSNGSATVLGAGHLLRISGDAVEQVRPGDSFSIVTQ